ncbi:MAG: hypothetical protein CMD97_05890 [Gammaproteobacteria bacterium]|nr:hypothetical protein [Gammaproteobacteria bacterium]|tara:strand:- start:237 stop:872 length:636 start_codon:yes stop_codon:yes gene_type:complete
MKTITGEDGETYILKSDMEKVIQERVSKVAERARTAEDQTKEFQSKIKELEKYTTSSDMLAQQVKDLKTQLDTSNQKYTRYKAVSKYGLVEDDMIDTLEFLYDKQHKDNKKAPSMTEWLDTMMSDVENAPTILRPHLQALQKETPPSVEGNETGIIDSQLVPASQHEPPKMNNGTAPIPTDSTLNQAKFNDLNWYSQNRERIVAEYRNRKK